MRVAQVIQEVVNYTTNAINEEFNNFTTNRRRRMARRIKLIRKIRQIISQSNYSTQIYLTRTGKIHYEHEKIVSKEGIIY